MGCFTLSSWVISYQHLTWIRQLGVLRQKKTDNGTTWLFLSPSRGVLLLLIVLLQGVFHLSVMLPSGLYADCHIIHQNALHAFYKVAIFSKEAVLIYK